MSRALKLIAEGVLAEGNMEHLAGRVGIGSRHLRRLFIQHLGVPPLKVARIHRVSIAKQLVEDTDLPMTEIAHCTGFGSIRQFNHDIRATFGHAPTELRDLRQDQERESNSGLIVQLPYLSPFDWGSFVRFMQPRITRLVEFIDTTVYRRTVQLGDTRGGIEVWPDPGHSRLLMRVVLGNYESLMQIVERVRRFFDLGANPIQIRQHLGRHAPFAALLRKRPGLRVPGAWDPFEIAVRAALGQRVTSVDRTEVIDRLVRTFGSTIRILIPGVSHLFPSSHVILNAHLGVLDIPEHQTMLLKAIAKFFSTEDLSSCNSLEAITAKLATISGIDGDSVSYIAMRGFSEPDAFPGNDPLLVRALNMGKIARPPAEVARSIEPLRPWRAYAAIHLEAALHEG